MSGKLETKAQVITFFNTNKRLFPDVVDDKIETKTFLDAATKVVELVDNFGTLFLPVKRDMTGNIEKINQKYNLDQQMFKFLNDLVLYEQNENQNRATDALLWLRRALHFFLEFFKSIVVDSKQNVKIEDMGPYLQKAYKTTLQMYHGWITQQIFNFICKSSPSRSDLFHTLALGKDDCEEIVVEQLEEFLCGLEMNITVLQNFYKVNNLEPSVKSSTK